MPIVMLGIRPLMRLLAKLVEAIIGKLATRFTRRAATTLTFIGLYMALLAGLAATFAGILAGIQVAMPADLASAVGYVKPPNFEMCLSAIFSAKVARWVYDHKTTLLEWQQRTLF